MKSPEVDFETALRLTPHAAQGSPDELYIENTIGTEDSDQLYIYNTIGTKDSDQLYIENTIGTEDSDQLFDNTNVLSLEMDCYLIHL